MPQVKPGPWFIILVLSWLIFSTIMPTKILSHTTPNEPTRVSAEMHKSDKCEWAW
uniref:ATP synthase complex subunit 8 n=1 Tax=Acrossocheilus paradoxus TaxID=76593 RepID=A0A125R6W4_ACRPD|nr:ATPase subunit 8 [Acrossocheilus paradoxus]AMD11921.1 ATPase subunit 8 [Acrossocheilus paradoxus]